MVLAHMREPVTLVVEDHDALRQAMCEWVGVSFGRCHVRQAASVEDALKLFESEQIDIVLMDVQLPGMNGIEGTRAILKRSPQTTVIMVSNHDDANHRADATAAGVSAFIAKRAIRTELTPILRNLLVHAVFDKNPDVTNWVNG